LRKYVAAHSIEAPRSDVSPPAVISNTATLIWQRFFSPSPWRTAAVAAVLLVAALGVWRIYFYQSEVDKGLVALNAAYREQRPIEARITQLDYAPFVTTRGPGTARFNESELRRAELTLLEALSKKPTLAGHHALGKVYLAKSEFDPAIQEFEEALKGDPNNAQIYADLGAAYLEKGKEELAKGKSDQSSSEAGKGFQYLARSLSSLSKALEHDPNLLEALYNKALCFEYMLLPEKAKEAWEAYLAHDSQSKWAEEARRHLANLSAQSSARPTAEQLLEKFLAALRDSKDELAWQILSANREPITGKMLSHQLERAYISTVVSGQRERAQTLLLAFFYAGDLEKRKGDDSYTLDLARYYAAVSNAQERLLADALGNIDRGYKLCLDTEYGEASRRFEEARDQFNKAGNSWEAKLADYWISYCYTQLDRIPESIQQLKPIVDYCEAHKYKWLHAQAEGWLAINYSTLSEHSNSIKCHRKSLELATGIHDTYQMQKSLTALGDKHAYLQQPESAFGYYYQSLSLAAESDGSPRQAWRNLLSTTTALFTFRYYEAAAAFGDEALRLGRNEFSDPTLTYLLHLRLGQIYSRLRRFDEAIQEANEGLQIAQSVLDPAARQKSIAGAFLNQAQILREAGVTEQAMRSYNHAIALYDSMNFDLHRYVAYKGRLLSALELNDQVTMEQDLPMLLKMFERYRRQIREEQYRNSFFDTEQDVYDIAIQHEYEARNFSKAVHYAEASHARSLLEAIRQNQPVALPRTVHDLQNQQASEPIDVEYIRQRLPDRLKVLMFTVLPKKLLVWHISRNEISVDERQVAAETLEENVLTFVRTLRDGHSEADRISSGKDLYRILIGSAENGRQEQDELCLIPDKFLYYLPFAALTSPESGRYLIEEGALFYAPSFNVMWNCSQEAQRHSQLGQESIVSVGNPSFDYETYPLPTLKAAEREGKEITRNFSKATYLSGLTANKKNFLRAAEDAEIIHFAGHYIQDDTNPMMSKMLLAPDARDSFGGSELTSSEIVQHEFGRTKLIVLSACQTGLDQYYNGEGAVGLARAFIEAGIPLVVASQWPVDSDVTADLMISMYRYRKSGFSTIAALRAAQVEMLHGPNEADRAPRNWAAFVCVGADASY
jgi:CHAT domain-containing protein/tetratricopeptide (TPR) repeat protein